MKKQENFFHWIKEGNIKSYLLNLCNMPVTILISISVSWYNPSHIAKYFFTIFKYTFLLRSLNAQRHLKSYHQENRFLWLRYFDPVCLVRKTIT